MAMWDYPPKGFPYWETRKPLTGYVLGSGRSFEMVLRVRLAPNQSQGRIAGGVVDYVSNGLPYQAHSGFSFRIGQPTAKCPSP